MLGLSYASSLSPRLESDLATLFTSSPSRVGHPGDPYKGVAADSLRELDLVGSCVWELASDKFGNTEGGREAEGRKRH